MYHSIFGGAFACAGVCVCMQAHTLITQALTNCLGLRAVTCAGVGLLHATESRN